MAMRPIAPQPMGSAPRRQPEGYPGSPTCNRAYLFAAVRTGLIALVLLTLLIATALF